FKIYLPVAAEEQVPAPTPAPSLPMDLNGSGTVLLVEDEDQVRTLTKNILQRSGYTVLEARHGAEALELYQDQLDSVQVAVTDVIRPEMTGRELAEHLHRLKPNMKVLYVSGYTDTVISQTGLLEKGTAFLEKPFTPHNLARKVHELMCT